MGSWKMNPHTKKLDYYESAADLQHAITSTVSHTSTATPGKVLKADANGLPIDATNTDTEVASAVSLKHTQGSDTTLGTMTADINMGGSYQVVALQAPATNGEAIRATTKITEALLESATDLKHTQNTDTKIIVGDTEVSITDTGSDGAIILKPDGATELTVDKDGVKVANLTATRVPFAGANGLLTDDADMTFATDTLTVTKIGQTTFTAFPITPTAAPDADYEVANKKYVDDAVPAAGATAALDNLASVAINTSLISDTDATDDLGSAAKQWKDIYASTRILVGGNIISIGTTQMVSTDFPNTTTLYFWNMDSTTDTAVNSTYAGTEYGATSLTITTTKPTAAADVLGLSKYNTWAASGYLASTSSNLDPATNSNFSFGGWVYRASWGTAPANNMILMSNLSHTYRGFQFYCNRTDGTCNFGSYNNGVSPANAMTATVSGLSNGWHHFVVSIGTSNNYVWIDGVQVATVAKAAFTAPIGGFQVGGELGANSLFTGRFDELFFHKATALTIQNAQAIYKASVGRFKFANPDGSVFIPGLTF